MHPLTHSTFQQHYQYGAMYDPCGRLLNPEHVTRFAATFIASRRVEALMIAVRQASRNGWTRIGDPEAI
jgi:hypothetical protein